LLDPSLPRPHGDRTPPLQHRASGPPLEQAATNHLLADGRHPFTDRRLASGWLPSVWAQDFWKVFLFAREEVREKILYVEENPVKEGKRRQRWSFVVPYEESVVD
jgi:hypothetical protein